MLNLVPGEARSDPSSMLLTTTFDAGSATQSLSLVDAGLFSGTWAQSSEGSYQLVASWPDAGLASSPITVIVDRTLPVFTVTVPPPPSRPAMYEDPALSPAWKRDEYVAVTVTCDKATVDPASVQFLLTGLDGGTSASQSVSTQAAPMTDGGCQHAYCGTANLDLSLPLMNDFTGNFGLQLRGQDLAGNVGTWTSLSGLPVTRFRWFFADAGAGSVGLPYSPGIGARGTAYFIDQGAQLFALSPQGTFLWNWVTDAGIMTGSPVVRRSDGGAEAVFVVNEAGVFSIDGNGAPPPVCSVGGKFAFDMAVVDTVLGGLGTPAEAALVPLPGEILAVIPDAPPGGQCVSATNTLAFPSSTDNIVTDGETLYVGDSMTSYAIELGQPFYFGSIAWTVPTSPGIALAIVGQFLVTNNGTDPTASYIGAIDRDAGVNVWGIDAGQPGEVWSYSGTTLIAGWATNNGPFDIAKFDIGQQTIPYVYSGVVISGVAIGSDGVVYVVDSNAQLLLALDSTLTPLWSRVINGNTQPALDCARDDAGNAIPGRPGSLYVGLYEGALSTIVDSHGLSVASSWPKHQHDPRNSGNAATSYACP